jgi:3'(2'), 5'-bisphosphate nucleotidase
MPQPPSERPVATPSDHLEAARIATLTGELLLTLRNELTAAHAHSGVLKREGDRQAHDLIMNELGRTRPDDAVLSEEGRDRPERLVADRVWIVDPLDGTREYGEGRHDWAVHIALVIDHQPVAGAVALPALGITLSTADPPPLLPLHSGAPRMIVSRSRPPVAALIVAEAIGAELISLGSAGAKTMAVVLGEADIYAHSGGQYEWDSCAPIAVARAAQLHTSRIDGSELVYNQRDSYRPDLLGCHPDLAAAALGALRA